MPAPFNVCDHEEIIPECEGCQRVYKCINGKLICGFYTCPHTQWWFGEDCPQATHIEHKDEEDPVKEP